MKRKAGRTKSKTVSKRTTSRKSVRRNTAKRRSRGGVSVPLDNIKTLI